MKKEWTLDMTKDCLICERDQCVFDELPDDSEAMKSSILSGMMLSLDGTGGLGMKNNVVLFCDPRAEDAMARLTERAWEDRRAEIMVERRRAERERRRRVHWITNVVMIGAIAAAAFAAGLCAGCL